MTAQPDLLAGRPPYRVPVVYTMGKVASTAVSDALDAAGLQSHAIHSLELAHLRRMVWMRLRRGQWPGRHMKSLRHYRKLICRASDTLYISLMREPIARNISAFFQNLHRVGGGLRHETDQDRLFAAFRDGYGHGAALTWFDREFRDQLGIDVYDHSFDRQARYCYLPDSHTVLFRTDCPDAVKSEVLSTLMGRKVTVARGNDGAEKYYSDRYARMTQTATFDAAFVARMYGSRYARHFWTDAERAAFGARWTGQG